MSYIIKLILAGFFTVCLSTSTLASDYPTIMVSIKPFYNICARVMQSVGQPVLLLKNNSSPHDYQLKPSDIKLIQSSDLLIWGGPSLEGYLHKILSNYPGKDLDLSTVKGLTLLPTRSHDHAHDHDHNHEHENFDPHFWLNPDNATMLADTIAQKLASLDPAHASKYLQNAAEFKQEIKAKNKTWHQELSSMQGKTYIVFHDAYQYFEQYFKLQRAAAININPEIPPSAKRVAELQTLLQQDHVSCIFSEPQFNQKIITTIVDGMPIFSGQLDPLGQEQDLGAQGYIILIDKLSQEFKSCGTANSN